MFYDAINHRRFSKLAIEPPILWPVQLYVVQLFNIRSTIKRLLHQFLFKY